MSKLAPRALPPDQQQRERSLDPTRSILVQAPAGSGKTTLLTERFLTLLAEVDEPGQVVAITFTNAAAAEMRNRILDELRAPDPSPLAQRVLQHSEALGWKLLDLPAQLRISTIDSFCRELALQQPLLSGLGGGLDIAEQPGDLYRRAARHTMEQIGSSGSPAGEAVEALLMWRDNNWQELENLLVEMLAKRDRWMQEFVLSRDPDWEALRERLERPFASAVREALEETSRLLDQAPGAREEALLLARFACMMPGGEQHGGLAELAAFPTAPFDTPETVDEAQQALVKLGNLVLIGEGSFRRAVDKRLGFPAERKAEKARLLQLIADLAAVPGLEASLAAVRGLPPAHYPEEDWLIVRACFTLLRQSAAELKVAFAEAAAVDFIEVAQIAESVLKGPDGAPTDAAIAAADGIRHLLVDEFQDTSRRQHQLLAGLIAAWPDRAGRTLFAVGDPMQSIYFFRDADAELFQRVKEIGLEIPNAEPFPLDFVPLSANFRTAPPLVERLNEVFTQVFAVNDGSGVTFSPATPALDPLVGPAKEFELHLNFAPQAADSAQDSSTAEDPQAEQVSEVVALIRAHKAAMDEARATGEKYRIAVLARAKKSLVPIAAALRESNAKAASEEERIPFRAVELEQLAARPEVLDALALTRALLNPQDRVAWLGVLRAPWCGLSLEDLHTLTSADEPGLLARPVPDLLAERLPLLSHPGRGSAERVLSALASVPALRASQPTAAPGTWLEQVWLSLGGAACCDPAARANVDLLWACLDRLPNGELDLAGPALDAALAKLTALPDPGASTGCGVQLMTIHKSKGLEFEVVIVPDLQARTAMGSRKLLSWLERGLPPDDDLAAAGEITEFLVAPLPSKGDDSGKPKVWVDRVYRQRELQETRRILYVAATRAREDLHLFARPVCRGEASEDLTLIAPTDGLLATAWPALEEEVRARFDAWKAARLASTDAESAEIASLAASGANGLSLVPRAGIAPAKPTLLRRLPEDFERQLPAFAPAQASAVSGLGLYRRHEGGMVSRALGTAVHSLLEELARVRNAVDWPAARTALARLEPRIVAQIRALGIAPAQAAKMAADAMALAVEASLDPTGQWILSPHTEAASEVRWTGVVGGALSSMRVDRVFRAGLAPLSDGQDAWWIVDYKTAHEEGLDAATALPQLHGLFAPQLETYARVLRNLHGADAVVRGALYYPRMAALDWWEL